MGGTLTFSMPVDRSRKLSKHFELGDLLVDATFPQLALELVPPPKVLANLERLTGLLDKVVERYPPRLEILSGYRDERLNDACREAGLPASVRSLHLVGCAADIKFTNPEVDPEMAFEWMRASAPELGINEAVYYPKKGFIHVAVVNPDNPTPQRILMRT